MVLSINPNVCRNNVKYYNVTQGTKIETENDNHLLQCHTYVISIEFTINNFCLLLMCLIRRQVLLDFNTNAQKIQIIKKFLLMLTA